MRIPSDALIPDAKLSQYLLVFRARNDKSKFLAQAGFSLQAPEQLRAAIRYLANENEAIPARTDQYGTFYEVAGDLRGPNGISLSVVTIWLEKRVENQFQFITLKPF